VCESTIWNDVALTVPKLTDDVLRKLCPEILTTVPPSTEPAESSHAAEQANSEFSFIE
jgi:hypothetical protein